MRRGDWKETLWIVALDVVFGAVGLALLLAAPLVSAMASSSVWPGSPQMAWLVRVDEWTLLFGLPLLWWLAHLKPQPLARTQDS